MTAEDFSFPEMHIIQNPVIPTKQKIKNSNLKSVLPSRAGIRLIWFRFFFSFQVISKPSFPCRRRIQAFLNPGHPDKFLRHWNSRFPLSREWRRRVFSFPDKCTSSKISLFPQNRKSKNNNLKFRRFPPVRESDLSVSVLFLVSGDF